MMAENERVNCPRFRMAEAMLRDLRDKINQAGRAQKARLAETLCQEARGLLSCPEYNGKSSGCVNCRFIANVCKRTAELILKVAKISARRI